MEWKALKFVELEEEVVFGLSFLIISKDNDLLWFCEAIHSHPSMKALDCELVL